MSPLVTLISPVYNSMPYLQDFLTCLEKQTWRPLEIILVDDGSSDHSRNCLQENKARLEAAGIAVELVFRPHQGQAAAFNAALPLVNGEFLTWCDSDDLMSDDSVEKKARWLMEHPQIGMVRSNGIVLNADTNEELAESARETDRYTKDIFEELFLDQCYCYAGCYMIRTDLFFICYPQKQIPVSPEGQNLQLLLPAASRSKCGYLSEKLHTYCRRNSGHSSIPRSYQENLQRIKNFTSLKLAILEYCDCDQAYFKQLAVKQEESKCKMLLHSAVQRARMEIKK